MKKKKIILCAVCAAVFAAGIGVGCYRYIQTSQAEERQTETETETGIEINTEAEIKPEESSKAEESTAPKESTAKEEETEKMTSTEAAAEETDAEAGQETEPAAEQETNPPAEEMATGSGSLPASADDFIIAEDADKFFENSVFIGDSVMMGFRNFVMGQPQGFLGSPEFLVSGSFSVRMALNTISDTTIHPIYQGEQRYIWDSISMMGAEKAFLFFGLNDIDMSGVDGTCENYAAVVGKIKEVNPDTSVYIISTTNMLTGSEKGGLNNDNIHLLNEKLKAYCETSGTGFIDIASFLVGEDGGLRPEYCSDGYVHETYAAYEIWTKVLRGFASGGKYHTQQAAEAETESSASVQTETEAESETESETGSKTE